MVSLCTVTVQVISIELPWRSMDPIKNKMSDNLPEEVILEIFIGFGFDSRSNDYKVVRMLELENFVNGVVHWIGFRQRKDIHKFSTVVLGLDMGYEVFREIMLPECLAHEDPMVLHISVYGESSIAVFVRDYSRSRHQCLVWVMKEYGVVGSWTKIMILGEQEERVARLLRFRKNGEILLMYPGRIASCDPESQHISDLGIQVELWFNFVDTYVESLVLLDIENVASDAHVASDD